MPEQLLREEDVADQLGIDPSTVKRWRTEGRGLGPDFVTVGRLVRYRQAAVDRWVEQQERSPAGS